MEKIESYPWKVCSFCGTVTDVEADKCPQEKILDDGKHELYEALLTVENLTEALKNGKIIARHHNHPQIKVVMEVKKIRS